VTPVPLSVYPVTPDFAAEIGDVDLARPLGAADRAAIERAFWRYAVLVFPGQRLTPEQHLAFARRFGPLETTIRVADRGTKLRLREELADVSNLDVDGDLLEERSRLRRFQAANRLWHTDSSFKPVPAFASLLYAREIPPVGGHTEFADARAAYDALPAETRRRLEGLVAEHSIAHSRARTGFTDFAGEQLRGLPPVSRALVRTIPESGRRTLYVASHAGRIPGVPDAEGKALIDELLAHATQPQFVYRHRWRVHDLVMWNDRCTLHRGTGFDELRWRRDVQRATVSDVAYAGGPARGGAPESTESR